MKKKMIIVLPKPVDQIIYETDDEIEGKLVSGLSEDEVKEYLDEYQRLFEEQFMNHWRKEKDENLKLDI